MTMTVVTVEDEVRSYVDAVMARLRVPPSRPALALAGPAELADAVFALLTSRRFSHLGRSARATYRLRTTELLRDQIERGEPLRFYYDIGPGYHASLHPDVGELVFDIGFSELMILNQVCTFAEEVARIYEPGVRFRLVIDNLCAHRTNDVPVDSTESYCATLRLLIDELGIGELVGLLVESEHFELSEYDRLLGKLHPGPAAVPTAKAHDNVERFLGRRCDTSEAAERIERYTRTSAVTEELLARVVDGVRMTQRATPLTIGFRPFPGGDSRTQCGTVVLGHSSNARLRPFLLTSWNVEEHDCARLAFPGLLPAGVRDVIYASPRPERSSLGAESFVALEAPASA